MVIATTTSTKEFAIEAAVLANLQLPEVAVLKKIREQLLAAVIGGIVSIILFAIAWVWGGIYERLRVKIADWVVSQISFTVEKSDLTQQEVTFACQPGEQLVSASCVGDNGGPQTAVGPVFRPDRSFSCYRFGNIPMKVQATAICYKIKGR
jgi:hypothetical protein